MVRDPYSTVIPFSLQVHAFYTALMRAVEGVNSSGAGREPVLEPSRGGQLFWAGELDATGRALAVAGNISGAATLVATARVEHQKQAVRDGVVDFMVTSLDEALRILKNEIRKHEPVAVCVAAALEAVEREMVERGVRPDLIREGIISSANRSELDREKKGDPEGDPMAMHALVVWKVEKAPALWLPKLDAIALGCLEPEDRIARRWIGLAGRTMGRLGHEGHLVWSNREFGARLLERTEECVRRGEINVRGMIQVTFGNAFDQYAFGPAESIVAS